MAPGVRRHRAAQALFLAFEADDLFGGSDSAAGADGATGWPRAEFGAWLRGAVDGGSGGAGSDGAAAGAGARLADAQVDAAFADFDQDSDGTVSQQVGAAWMGPSPRGRGCWPAAAACKRRKEGRWQEG
jgi:hypothetical protein